MFNGFSAGAHRSRAGYGTVTGPVASLSALNTAVNAASPGDVILLASGTYDASGTWDPNPAQGAYTGYGSSYPGITIRAADPSNPPVIGDTSQIQMTDNKWITWESIKFKSNRTAGRLNKFMTVQANSTGSNNITFRNCIFEGSNIATDIEKYPPSGTQTATSADPLGITLTDTGKTISFFNTNAGIGNLIENLTDGSSATVASITGSNTLTCSGLTGGSDNQWEIGDSYRITLSRYNGYGCAAGIEFPGTRNIKIIGCTFTNLWIGLQLFGAQNVLVENCLFTGIHLDAVESGGSQNITFRKNTVRDFDKDPDTVDHGDCYQQWTTGASGLAGNRNVKVQENVFFSGYGTRAGASIETQTMFGENEWVNANPTNTNSRYRNHLYEHNVVHNAHANGIFYKHVDGLTIRNNTLVLNKDAALDASPTTGLTDAIWRPRITTGGSDSSTNIVSQNNVQVSTTGALSGTNVTTQIDDPLGDYYVADMHVNPFVPANSVTLKDLWNLPGSYLDTNSLGSRLCQFSPAPGEKVGYITTSYGTGYLGVTTVTFGVVIRDKDGVVSQAGATYSWDFGDTNTSTSAAPAHTYDDTTNAFYDASVDVTLSGGEVVTVNKTVRIISPLVAKSTFDFGAADTDTISPAGTLVSGGLTFPTGNSGTGVQIDTSGVTYQYVKDAKMRNRDEYSVVFDYKKLSGTNTGRILTYSSFLLINLNASGALSATATSIGTFTGTSIADLQDTDFHRHVITFSSHTGTAEYYIDTVLIDSFTGLEGVVVAGDVAQNLVLGNNSGTPCAGIFDNFHFLNGYLTSAQVTTIGTAAANTTVTLP